MEAKKIVKGRSQNIILEDRQKISISAVEHVHSFDECSVIVETSKGVINIKGSSFDMSKLNLEDGNVVVKGCVDSIVYTDKQSLSHKGGSILSRMFK